MTKLKLKTAVTQLYSTIWEHACSTVTTHLHIFRWWQRITHPGQHGHQHRTQGDCGAAGEAPPAPRRRDAGPWGRG